MMHVIKFMLLCLCLSPILSFGQTEKNTRKLSIQDAREVAFQKARKAKELKEQGVDLSTETVQSELEKIEEMPVMAHRAETSKRSSSTKRKVIDVTSDSSKKKTYPDNSPAEILNSVGKKDVVENEPRTIRQEPVRRQQTEPIMNRTEQRTTVTTAEPNNSTVAPTTRTPSPTEIMDNFERSTTSDPNPEPTPKTTDTLPEKSDTGYQPEIDTETHVINQREPEEPPKRSRTYTTIESNPDQRVPRTSLETYKSDDTAPSFTQEDYESQAREIRDEMVNIRENSTAALQDIELRKQVEQLYVSELGNLRREEEHRQQSYAMAEARLAELVKQRQEEEARLAELQRVRTLKQVRQQSTNEVLEKTGEERKSAEADIAKLEKENEAETARQETLAKENAVLKRLAKERKAEEDRLTDLEQQKEIEMAKQEAEEKLLAEMEIEIAAEEARIAELRKQTEAEEIRQKTMEEERLRLEKLEEERIAEEEKLAQLELAAVEEEARQKALAQERVKRTELERQRQREETLLAALERARQDEEERQKAIAEEKAKIAELEEQRKEEEAKLAKLRQQQEEEATLQKALEEKQALLDKYEAERIAEEGRIANLEITQRAEEERLKAAAEEQARIDELALQRQAEEARLSEMKRVGEEELARQKAEAEAEKLRLEEELRKQELKAKMAAEERKRATEREEDESRIAKLSELQNEEKARLAEMKRIQKEGKARLKQIKKEESKLAKLKKQLEKEQARLQEFEQKKREEESRLKAQEAELRMLQEKNLEEKKSESFGTIQEMHQDAIPPDPISEMVSEMETGTVDRITTREIEDFETEEDFDVGFEEERETVEGTKVASVPVQEETIPFGERAEYPAIIVPGPDESKVYYEVEESTKIEEHHNMEEAVEDVVSESRTAVEDFTTEEAVGETTFEEESFEEQDFGEVLEEVQEEIEYVSIDEDQREFIITENGEEYILVEEEVYVDEPVSEESSETPTEVFEYVEQSEVDDVYKPMMLESYNFSVDNYKGKVVVMNFWFAECKMCIQEIPKLNKLVEKYGSENIVFLGLSTNMPEKALAISEREKFLYQIVPMAKPIAEKYWVYAYPTHFVFDTEGNRVASFTGNAPKVVEELEQAIVEELEK